MCEQVLILNVMGIGLATTEHTAGISPYLVLFLLAYTVELAVRVVAEGVRDFWSFSRLEAMRAAFPYRATALRYDIVVVATAVAAYVASRLATV